MSNLKLSNTFLTGLKDYKENSGLISKAKALAKKGPTPTPKLEKTQPDHNSGVATSFLERQTAYKKSCGLISEEKKGEAPSTPNEKTLPQTSPAIHKNFLTAEEIQHTARSGPSRGDTQGLSSGNHVELKLNGEEVFQALHEKITNTVEGDCIWVTLWRLDKSISLTPSTTDKVQHDQGNLVELLKARYASGVDVKIVLHHNGLSGAPIVGMGSPDNAPLTNELNAWAAENNLDPWVRLETGTGQTGNFHQKSWLITNSGHATAYVGSMDMMPGRYDDKHHDNSPERQKLCEGATLDKKYGWIGGMLELTGPITRDIAHRLKQQINKPAKSKGWTFWPTPYNGSFFKQTTIEKPPVRANLPKNFISKAAGNGNTQAQLLITSCDPENNTEYAFDGERSILLGLIKAINNAESSIIICDQFMTYEPIMTAIAKRLEENKNVNVILFTNDHTSTPYLGRSLTANQCKAFASLEHYKEQGRVFAYHLVKEGKTDEPCNELYNHLKGCIIDDKYGIFGSAGIETSGLTHDTDLSIAFFGQQVAKCQQRILADFLNIKDTEPRYDRLTNFDDILNISQATANLPRNQGRIHSFWPAYKYWKVMSVIMSPFDKLIHNHFEPDGGLTLKQETTILNSVY